MLQEMKHGDTTCTMIGAPMKLDAVQLLSGDGAIQLPPGEAAM